ncbi:MAG TPA: PAS domain S-box protein [Bacteroidia bacterium]
MSLKNKTKQELIDEINELKKQLRKGKPVAAKNDIVPELYENVPYCYILFDDKKIIYINKIARGLLMIPQSVLKAGTTDLFSFIDKDYHQVLKKSVKNTSSKAANAYGTEIICTNYKKQKRVVEVFCKLVSYNGKKVYQGFFRDITGTKDIQTELVKARDNFKDIVSKIDEVVFYYNKKEKRIEYISDQLYELIGVKSSDYIKNPQLTVDLAHPDDLPKLFEANKLLNSRKEPQNFTYRVYHKKKKSYVWIEEKIFPEFDKNGKHVANLGISRDVTEELTRKEKLKQSEEKYRLLAENASDVIFTYAFKPTPHYTYISPSMETITGYPVENFYKDPFFGFKITHPDDKNKPSVKETVKTLEEGLDRFEEVHRPQVVRFIRKDGKTIWLETRYTQIIVNGEHIGQEGISRDITAQKEAELILAEKEQTIRNLFNNLPGMAYRCLNDKHWTMQFLSEGCYELTGYKPFDLINNKNKTYSDIVHPEDRLVGKEDIYFAIKNKTVFEIEYRIISKHNKVIWVWEKGEGIYDRDGNLLYIEGFITDVSERKKYEAELNQKWLDYKNLVDSLPIGIILHDHGKIMLANSSALQMAGFVGNEKEVNLFQFLNPELRPGAEERIRKVLEGRETKPVVYPITNAQNKKLFVRITSTPVFFNGKKVIQLSAEDLTQEILLEKERQRAQKAESTNEQLQHEIDQRIITEKQLEQTKNYLQLLINSSLDMISANDRNGYITEINEAGLKTFGYEPNDLIGKQAGILFSEKNPQYEANKFLIKHGYFRGEVINKRKNGEEFISFLSASILKNENGEIIGTMGISRDITEQKERERLLLERQEQIVKQSSRLKAIFDSSSHLVWTVDKNQNITSFNTNFANVVREKYGVEVVTQESISDKISDKKSRQDYINFWKPLYERVFKGESVKTERHDLADGGGDTYRLIYLNPIYSEGEVVEISCLANDITEIKNYERQITEQASKLKAIFENGNQLFWTVNNNRELVTFNNQYAKAIYDIYGFYPEKGKQLKTAGQDKVEHHYYDFWGDKYKDVFDNKRTINFVTERTKADDKKKIYRQIFLYPIFDEKGDIIEIGGMGLDITDLKYYQEKTTEQAAKLNTIIENSHHQIWSLNHKFELTSLNTNYERFMEEIFGIKPKIGDCMVADPFITTKEANEKFRQKLMSVFEGNNVEFVYNAKNKKGKMMWRETFLSPIFDKEGKVIEISGIANDITLRKTIEDEKNRQAALIKAIFDSSSHLIFTINKNYEITSFNKNYYNHVKENHGHETYVGKSILTGGLKNAAPKDFEEWKERHDSVIAGKPSYYKNMAVQSNGEVIYFETFMDPVYLPGGEIEEVSYISLDITDKYKAEKELTNSLREKDILLKEVHHRVKNNLQVISSILNLQSTYVKDEKTLYILRECQNRIKSMAFIHEALYQNKNFSEIPFNEYLTMLVKNLFHSYNINNVNIKLNFDIDEVFLNLDTSIPCGLIVNELVSNSFKYAFPDEKQGFIFISLKQKNNDVTLIIKDNGAGLPNEVDFRNTESLGLQLVVTLVEQIGGNIKLDNTNGTKFEITFKQIEKNV